MLIQPKRAKDKCNRNVEEKKNKHFAEDERLHRAETRCQWGRWWRLMVATTATMSDWFVRVIVRALAKLLFIFVQRRIVKNLGTVHYHPFGFHQHFLVLPFFSSHLGSRPFVHTHFVYFLFSMRCVRFGGSLRGPIFKWRWRKNKIIYFRSATRATINSFLFFFFGFVRSLVPLLRVLCVFPSERFHCSLVPHFGGAEPKNHVILFSIHFQNRRLTSKNVYFVF